MLKYGLPYGYSDHSRGITAALLAIALGAQVIEKHVTYDTSMGAGPDHIASIDFEDLEELTYHATRMELMFE